jgi:hypothetical protein
MNFLKDWNDEQHKTALRKFKDWERHNLIVTYGKREYNPENTYGLPYTSSGDYAGLWNTNVIAVYSKNRNYRFNGIAINTDKKVVAVFTEYSDDIDIELKTQYVEIQ